MTGKISFLVLSAILFVRCAENTNTNCTKNQPADKVQIIETVNKLFIGADEHNWEQVAAVFNDTVLLDYTSMSGGEPAKMSAIQIIDSWKGILPGFDKTHHQLGNYVVNTDSANIHVFCYGTATHYLKNESDKNVWTVVGTYDLELDSALKVTKMKFNLKFIDGNSNLPALAQEKLKK